MNILRAAAIVLAGGLVFRGCFVRGVVAPMRIAGGSMAETLLGDHFFQTCADCRFPIRFDADAPPTDQRVICPNCGHTNLLTSNIVRVRGDRVLVDVWPKRWGRIRRWDIVAAEMPGERTRRTVKRVVGLPNERLRFHHGDVFVDDIIQRKTLRQFKALAVLVHDATFRVAGPDAGLERWVTETNATGWKKREHGFAFSPQENRRGAVPEWLTYRNTPCYDGSRRRREDVAVLDTYGYNQSTPRQLQHARDLGLSCELKIHQPGPPENSAAALVAFEFRNSEERLTAVCDVRANTVCLYGRAKSGEAIVLAAAELPPVGLSRGVQIDWACFDRRIVLAIDEHVVLEHDLPTTTISGGPRSTPRPFAIGATGCAAMVSKLRIFRDIVYLDAMSRTDHWRAIRPTDQAGYFLLGDNPPISVDSRHWPSAAVQRSTVIGRVLE